MAHGTRSSYQLGCRCLRCRAAEAQYRTLLRRRHVMGQVLAGAYVPAREARALIRRLLPDFLSRANLARALGLRAPMLRLGARWVRRRTYRRLKQVEQRYGGEGE